MTKQAATRAYLRGYFDKVAQDQDPPFRVVVRDDIGKNLASMVVRARQNKNKGYHFYAPRDFKGTRMWVEGDTHEYIDNPVDEKADIDELDYMEGTLDAIDAVDRLGRRRNLRAYSGYDNTLNVILGGRLRNSRKVNNDINTLRRYYSGIYNIR